ncbi:class I tRNA ligase family protein [Streptomyces sp. NBC_01104]|uniref:class I tRNA ligase family protein n=1 Tax=Streptomyces sp. NBC_01104 TaxID=2903750 RepID=UPI003863D020|nr:class I tRNA ligase family protein [Streptomyces sp. NBC_01104]
MKISAYDPAALRAALGIDMSDLDLGSPGPGGSGDVGVHTGWGRVVPGASSMAHQHDENEVFVIVSGRGEIVVNGQVRHPAAPGVVALFEPFDTHVLENHGSDDLVFATFYWRDARRASTAAADGGGARLGHRPRFVFSTPPTPNGDLHLGHLSGPYLGADAYVRFQRMNGADAWHITGSDDHQSYVTEAARREGRTSAETAAHYGAEIAATLALMDIHPDQYTTTAGNAEYAEGLQAFFDRVVASGRVEPRPGPALFDAGSGEYLYEVDVHGSCPSCAAPAGGNICEECGEPNNCAELGGARSGRSDLVPERGSVTRYSLPLHEFGTDLADHHRLGRVPARLRELTDRLLGRDRLDIALTHPSSWGVAPASSDAEGEQVIWVWPEMSYGFLYGIEAIGRANGRDWRAGAPGADWKIVHFFGYDNSFYHSMLYPVLYKLAHPGWTPDVDYHVNEFYLLEGEKFSTSRRHAVWGKEILGPDSVDAVRFFLSRTRPEGRRTDFRHAAYGAVLEEELIGGWQAWLQDLGGRIEKDYAGRAPDAGIWTREQTAFLARLNGRLAALTAALGPDAFSLNQAADELSGIVADAIRFSRVEARTAQSEKWSDENRTTIALELCAARLLAMCATPVMPRFAERLATALGMPPASEWPATSTLLPAGSVVDLSGQVFFTADRGER